MLINVASVLDPLAKVSFELLRNPKRLPTDVENIRNFRTSKSHRPKSAKDAFYEVFFRFSFKFKSLFSRLIIYTCFADASLEFCKFEDDD